MASSSTFFDNLNSEFMRIVEKTCSLIEISTIERMRHNYDSIVIIGPEYSWGKPTEDQKLLQIELIDEFKMWRQKFELLLKNIPVSDRQNLIMKINSIFNWIDRSRLEWGLPANLIEAKERFLYNSKEIEDFLKLLHKKAPGRDILIPDTNALIIEPNIENYSKYVNSKNITICLLPTVLEELDKLKVIHREPDFRQKVKSVINRLKGFRKQGDVTKGVKVFSNITIKFVPAEPDFSNTLDWLDKNNKDDRIIASILEIQLKNISSKVFLLTADINLQSKAEMASISYIDID